jgi:REP element-mobilizing transposase RayT
VSVYRRFHDHAFPSLITTSIADRKALLGAEKAARLFIRTLREVKQETDYHLFAFVVMPDHVHLVLRPPASHSLGQVIQLIKGRFSRHYNEMTGRSGRLWQSRYHERALRSEGELLSAIEYVHGNPVAAGLASEASTYPWSSAGGNYRTDLALYFGQAEA